MTRKELLSVMIFIPTVLSVVTKMTFFDWLNQNPGWFCLYLVIIFGAIQAIFGK